jgi:hypothetical protein
MFSVVLLVAFADSPSLSEITRFGEDHVGKTYTLQVGLSGRAIDKSSKDGWYHVGLKAVKDCRLQNLEFYPGGIFSQDTTNFLVSKANARKIDREIGNDWEIRTITVKIEKEKIGDREYVVGTITRIER